MFGLVPASSITFPMIDTPSLLGLAASPLARLGGLDIAVIAIYFAMVLWIGF
jgi:hypothetical protein